MPLGPNAAMFHAKILSERDRAASTTPAAPFEIGAFRTSVDSYFGALLQDAKPHTEISIEKKALNFDQHHVKATIYRPVDITGPIPVIIFHPGGGLALDMADCHAHACANMSQSAHAAVVCIQPELSPEHKFPEIFTAAYEATKYFYQQAHEYDFDPTRLIVSGYSMGGTLAALITNKARDDRDLIIAGQVIVSGVFNLGTPPLSPGEDFMFDPAMHVKFVEMCLPGGKSVPEIREDPKFSPVKANLTGLPPTCLIAGECDVFKDDTEEMARKLGQAGVIIETTIIPGQIHNTLLLYPVMGDNKDPSIAAGECAASLFRQCCSYSLQ